MAIPGRIFLVFILFISSIPLFPANGQPISGGARKLALASSVIALPGYPWAEENPASPGYISKRVASLFMSRKFGLRELQISAFNIVQPIGATVLALEGQSFGFQSYRELLFRGTIAHAWNFGSSRPVWTGLSFTLKNVTIEDYGNTGVYSLSFGLLFEIWPALYLGTSTLHTIQSASPIAFIERYQTGLAYQFQESSWLLLKVSKMDRYPTSLHMGAEFAIQRGIQLRTGMSTQPHVVSVGLGIIQHVFTFHLTAERHYLLGWTPALSIDAYL